MQTKFAGRPKAKHAVGCTYTPICPSYLTSIKILKFEIRPPTLFTTQNLPTATPPFPPETFLFHRNRSFSTFAEGCMPCNPAVCNLHFCPRSHERSLYRRHVSTHGFRDIAPLRAAFYRAANSGRVAPSHVTKGNVSTSINWSMEDGVRLVFRLLVVSLHWHVCGRWVIRDSGTCRVVFASLTSNSSGQSPALSCFIRGFKRLGWAHASTSPQILNVA